MQALGADIGVIGQGEVTMHELAATLNEGRVLDAIPGLIFKRDGRYVTTPARREIADLDSLPLAGLRGLPLPGVHETG